MNFNNNIWLVFFQDGQFWLWDSGSPQFQTGYLTFNLSDDIVGNIYEIFEMVDIDIPEPLYLESINFGQQMFENSNPPDEIQEQSIEVDYVRILFNLDKYFDQLF